MLTCNGRAIDCGRELWEAMRGWRPEECDLMFYDKATNLAWRPAVTIQAFRSFERSSLCNTADENAAEAATRLLFFLSDEFRRRVKAGVGR